MTPEEAIAIAQAAAHLTDTDATNANLVRLGENAVVLLPASNLVAKISSGASAERTANEYRIAHWLERNGVPVVRYAGDAPVIIGDFVVAFSEYLPEPKRGPLSSLARQLHKLHSLPIPPDLGLKPIHPFGSTATRLASSKVLTHSDKSFLRGLLSRTQSAWSAIELELPSPVVVHGDAHSANLIRAVDGREAFIDLERVGIGCPEWDLTLSALYVECGWHTATDYRAFAEIYGYDVRASPSWPTLRMIRMLRMTAWLSMTATTYPDRRVELEERVAGLRNGTAPDGWNGF